MCDLKMIAERFDVRGDFLSAEPYGSGHINDTYAAWYRQGGRLVRYIHQRINHAVFKDPDSLMDNIVRTTRHLQHKLRTSGDPETTRKALALVPAIDGNSCYRDEKGNTWRTYIFIENARTLDQVLNVKQAYEAARAFGRFQKELRDLSGRRLVETIPNFHNTRARFNALISAIEADAFNRACNIKQEIEFAFQREGIVDTLIKLQQGGQIPEIVTHNDTKLNNVMLDDETSEGICVIDLDTVMPGLSLYDFGDMARTMTSTAPEDERDLSRVHPRMDMFEAITRGYLSSVGDLLTKTEIEQMPFAARLITFEIGIRFLTDYLEGDIYFKTHRDCQNVDRTRVQFKLVQSFEEREDVVTKIVAAAGQQRDPVSSENWG